MIKTLELKHSAEGYALLRVFTTKFPPLCTLCLTLVCTPVIWWCLLSSTSFYRSTWQLNFVLSSFLHSCTTSDINIHTHDLPKASNICCFSEFFIQSPALVQLSCMSKSCLHDSVLKCSLFGFWSCARGFFNIHWLWPSPGLTSAWLFHLSTHIM